MEIVTIRVLHLFQHLMLPMQLTKVLTTPKQLNGLPLLEGSNYKQDARIYKVRIQL